MIGIDVADIARVAGVLARHPRAEERLFTKAERTYCRSFADPLTHFAGTFAAKEAVVKALRLGSILAWARRVEIVRESDRPVARVANDARARDVMVSISHDGGVAIAVAVSPHALQTPTPRGPAQV